MMYGVVKYVENFAALLYFASTHNHCMRGLLRNDPGNLGVGPLSAPCRHVDSPYPLPPTLFMFTAPPLLLGALSQFAMPWLVQRVMSRRRCHES